VSDVYKILGDISSSAPLTSRFEGNRPLLSPQVSAYGVLLFFIHGYFNGVSGSWVLTFLMDVTLRFVTFHFCLIGLDFQITPG